MTPNDRHEDARSKRNARSQTVSSRQYSKGDPARRILMAARRILRRRGFSALTLQEVAESAGLRKPAVAYYYGSKAGLVAAVVDSINRSMLEHYEREAESMSADTERLDAYFELGRKMVQQGGPEEFFEVLPAARRDRQVRESMRSLFDRYREINATTLAMGHEDATDAHEKLTPLATLVNAVIDGLAIQTMLQVDGEIVDAAFDQWKKMALRSRLEELNAGQLE